MKIVVFPKPKQPEKENQDQHQEEITTTPHQDLVHSLEVQIKRVNLYLISLLIFLVIFNFSSFIYSQTQEQVQEQEQDQQEQQQQFNQEEKKDILSYLFENSITSMLLSTFVIAIIGVLVAKLRGFKKKLDMIEILTKAMIKMKKQSEDRETRLEKRLKELDDKIDNVEREATAALIRYLSDSSFDRKR
jgi:uncharacterized protein YqhQ